MAEQGGGRRRRGAELEAAVLEAAWEELEAVGYARLTMEGVAARARTGKQVLYRRWPNRAQLVIAAVRHTMGGSLADQVPDTGSLREDLLEVVRWPARRQRQVGADVVHGLLAEVGDLEPEFHTLMANVLGEVLKRAAERGEIRTAELPRRVVTVPTDLVRHEVMVARGPIPESALVEIVDEVCLPLLGAVAGWRPLS